MRYTEIYYTVNGGKESVEVVHEKEGWEVTYYQGVVHTIQSLLDAPKGYRVVIKRVRTHE